MGHVPAGPFREEGAGRDVPRLQHRGTRRTGRALAQHRRAVARLGEALAASFLRERGARILGRNLRSQREEVDLLVEINGVIIAVEVKTRLGDQDPRDGFSDEKARRVRRGAMRLRPRPQRIDFIGVALDADGAAIRWVPYAG